MPVNKNGSKWDEVLSTISTSGSDWVTTSSAVSDWVTVSTPTTTTDSYIWTTSTTPITTGSSTITITYPPVSEITWAPREYEFPFLDTYNLESPKGREKYLTTLKDYLNFLLLYSKINIFTQKQKESQT